MSIRQIPKRRIVQIVAVLVILLTVTGIYIYRHYNNPDQDFTSTNEVKTDKKLPKLIDLGAGTCIPCKRMMPILKELQKEYEGKVIIEIIDVNEHPDEAQKYGIYAIPTQILFDTEGKELGRNVGEMSKEDLKQAFKEWLGVE